MYCGNPKKLSKMEFRKAIFSGHPTWDYGIYMKNMEVSKLNFSMAMSCSTVPILQSGNIPSPAVNVCRHLLMVLSLCVSVFSCRRYGGVDHRDFSGSRQYNPRLRFIIFAQVSSANQIGQPGRRRANTQMQDNGTSL